MQLDSAQDSLHSTRPRDHSRHISLIAWRNRKSWHSSVVMSELVLIIMLLNMANVLQEAGTTTIGPRATIAFAEDPLR